MPYEILMEIKFFIHDTNQRTVDMYKYNFISLLRVPASLQIRTALHQDIQFP